MDEESIHDSFSQLIEEQSQNGGLSEAFELQLLQSELDEESRGVTYYYIDMKLDTRYNLSVSQSYSSIFHVVFFP